MLPTLINALRETLYMVLYASFFSIIIGIPFGFIVARLQTSKVGFGRIMYHILYTILQTVKSIPYVLVMLLFIPTTNWLINHHISFTTATIVPLTVAGTLLLAQAVYSIALELQEKWKTNIKAMGASHKQTFWHILLPESAYMLIEASANTSSTIVGFSIIAGAFGAGGLGQFAIEKTITEPNYLYSMLSILTLIAIQQILKYTALLIVPLKS